MDEAKPSTSTKLPDVDVTDSESNDSEEYDEENKDYLLQLKKVTDDYGEELEKDFSKQKKKRRSNKKKASKMHPHLIGLMGEANLRFARGELETCEKMCFEIIRQAPLAYEPYITLSQVYENTHLEKSIEYLTMAAYLKPYDIDQWCRLAQMNIDNGNKRKAITCYTRGLRYHSQDYEVQKKRIKLLQELGMIFK